MHKPVTICVHFSIDRDYTVIQLLLTIVVLLSDRKLFSENINKTKTTCSKLKRKHFLFQFFTTRLLFKLEHNFENIFDQSFLYYLLIRFSLCWNSIITDTYFIWTINFEYFRYVFSMVDLYLNFTKLLINECIYIYLSRFIYIV